MLNVEGAKRMKGMEDGIGEGILMSNKVCLSFADSEWRKARSDSDQARRAQ